MDQDIFSLKSGDFFWFSKKGRLSIAPLALPSNVHTWSSTNKKESSEKFGLSKMYHCHTIKLFELSKSLDVECFRLGTLHIAVFNWKAIAKGEIISWSSCKLFGFHCSKSLWIIKKGKGNNPWKKPY